MGVVFILGPSESLDSTSSEQEHLDVRRDLAAIVAAAGHDAVLMEEVPDDDGSDEDLIQKFERILDGWSPTAIIVYWPWRAKMQTTFDDLLLLRKRWESRALPPV